MTKLHLGCGTVYLDGWVNVDVEGPNVFLAKDHPEIVQQNITTKENYYKNIVQRDEFLSGQLHDKYKVVDVFADVRGLEVFEDRSVDHVFSNQVLEHFSKLEGELLLEYWIRKLKKGGVLEVDIPDLEGTIELFNNKQTPEDLEWFLRLMFGSQKNEYSYHKWMYTKDSAINLFQRLGLSDIEITPNIHTYPGFGIKGTK